MSNLLFHLLLLQSLVLGTMQYQSGEVQLIEKFSFTFDFTPRLKERQKGEKVEPCRTGELKIKLHVQAEKNIRLSRIMTAHLVSGFHPWDLGATENDQLVVIIT